MKVTLAVQCEGNPSCTMWRHSFSPHYTILGLTGDILERQSQHNNFFLLFGYVNIWTFLGCSIFEQATEHPKKKKKGFSVKKKKKRVKAGFFAESSCDKDLGGVWTYFWALCDMLWKRSEENRLLSMLRFGYKSVNRGVQTKPIQQNLYSGL